MPALPELEGGAVGRLIAEATAGMLQQWDSQDCIKGICFDTTASNTGKAILNFIKMLHVENEN